MLMLVLRAFSFLFSCACVAISSAFALFSSNGVNFASCDAFASAFAYKRFAWDESGVTVA